MLVLIGIHNIFKFLNNNKKTFIEIHLKLQYMFKRLFRTKLYNTHFDWNVLEQKGQRDYVYNDIGTKLYLGWSLFLHQN